MQQALLSGIESSQIKTGMYKPQRTSIEHRIHLPFVPEDADCGLEWDRKAVPLILMKFNNLTGSI